MKPKDILIYSIVPVISLIFYILNPDFLKLNLHNPKGYQFFTSVFVHATGPHISYNLLMYAITVSLGLFYGGQIYILNASGC